MENKLSVAFIIRFHYEVEDQKFWWRYNYFKDKVMPRIQKQTYKDFDICIRCYSKHNDLFVNLDPRIKTFQVKEEATRHFVGTNNKTYFEDHTTWDKVMGLKKYDVQIGLDSDDLIEDTYVQIIVSRVNQYINQYPNKSLHICFQPEKYISRDDRKKPMMDYTETRGSAFFAVYQPDKVNYKFGYQQSHITLGRLFDKSIVIPSGHCMATVHNFNESTR